MTDIYQFDTVKWLAAAADIMEIRKKVFVVEQRFDKEVLCDQFDHNCYHVLVRDRRGECVGCGRLIPDGRIGKIAVLINRRGNGIGSGILRKLIKIAQRKQIANLALNAETELTAFYDQQKFHADGPVYMKQGVPYQRMIKRLA